MLPRTLRALLDELVASAPALSIADYRRLSAALGEAALAQIRESWGEPDADPELRDGAFRFRARLYGNVVVALPPDRGRPEARRADYHDPALPPRHALVAFWLWLREVAKVQAVVHMGAHGTLEWLPGKAVALTRDCYPEALIGALPVVYPFLVSNPGEAAQAKRRIAAVTIGHLPPPLVENAHSAAGVACAATPDDGLHALERLVDEFVQAAGLDHKRRDRLARLIVETARRSGLGHEAELDLDGRSDEALRRIDTWLCDLKELAIKDGLHVYGRAKAAACRPGDDSNSAAKLDPLRVASAAAEREALLAALDGSRVAPGPAGAPSRGRADVLPTGRNLFTADPRMLPTPTAMELGRLAADEVVREYMQTHGEVPRALVLDLWGSATLRTGGEEIAQGLALMGCRPTWEHASGRVTGIEVLPAAAIGRARIDVTWRISGLFRDLFPAQIALIDAAVRAVAARQDEGAENPLALAWRAAGAKDATTLARIFSTAPGSDGSGVEHLLVTTTIAPRWGLPTLPPPATCMAGPMEEHVRRPRLSPKTSPPPTCSCIPATIPGGTCSKAGRMRPLSAALPPPLPRSAAAPISSPSIPPTRNVRAPGH